MRDYERKGIRFLNAGGSVDIPDKDKPSIIIIDIINDIYPTIYELASNKTTEINRYYMNENIPSLVS